MTSAARVSAAGLPIAVGVAAIAARHVPESRDASASGRVDAAGGVLVTLGLVGLTFGLIEGAALGWSSTAVLGALAGGVVLLAVFAWHERRTDHPMLPVDIFASGQFTATNAVTFVVYGALGGALFLLPIQLQQVSAINNDVARAGGLIAVAVLPAAAGITGYAYQHPGAFDHGFTTAVLLAAAICALGGCLAAITIRNPARKPASPRRSCFNCAVDASALVSSTEGR
jgi:hypothetical protein